MPAKPFSSKGTPLVPYHLRDDFGGDASLDSRSGTNVGLHFDGQRSSVASTLLAGRYRPRWHVYNSGPRIKNAGIIHDYGSNGRGGVVTGCKQTIGEWRVGIQFSSVATDPNPDVVDITLIGAHTGDACPRWGVRFYSDRRVHVYKRGDDDRDGESEVAAETMVSGQVAYADRHQTITVQRAPDNEWQLLIDGISQGATRDSFLPPTGVCDIAFESGSDAGSDVRIDHVEVW